MFKNVVYFEKLREIRNRYRDFGIFFTTLGSVGLSC